MPGRGWDITPAPATCTHAPASWPSGTAGPSPRPRRSSVRARAEGSAESLPARRAKAEKPLRRGVAFWAVRPDGAVLLRRRPEKGLLGGMMEVPSTPWRQASWSEAEAKAAAPVAARWRLLPGVVRHSFTHFHLELAVLAGEVRAGFAKGGQWTSLDQLTTQALPTVMKKIVAHARGGPRRWEGLPARPY